MKKQLLLASCFAIAATIGAGAQLQLVQEDKYGDTMGTTTAKTTETFSFYDESNILVRRVTNAYESPDYVNVQPYYIYIWDNSNGHHDAYYYYQWRAVYDKWSTVKDSTIYTYDDAGHLIKEEQILSDTYKYINEYTWEGDNMVKHVYSMDYNGNVTVNRTTTYSNFLEGVANKPQNESCVGNYNSTTYTRTYTYDANNNVVLIEKLDYEGNPSEKEEYTYDENNICTLKTVYSYSSGAYKPKSRVVREAQGNNVYRRTENTYSQTLGDWNSSGIYFMETYAAVDASYAPRNLVVASAATAQNPVNVVVSCDEPATVPADAQYIIWRDWEKLATVAAVDGKITYTDNTASTGEHAYYVQTIDATAAYNVTTPVKVNVEVELPPVSNIRYMGGYNGVYNDPQSGSYDTYYVKIAWDAPATSLEVLGYEVYEEGFNVAIAELGPKVTTYDFSVYSGNSITFRVVALYSYGEATSEYVTFNFDRTDVDVEYAYEMTQCDTYGDAMGAQGLTGTSYYLYDGSNNIVREFAVGYGYDGVLTPESRHFYLYNDEGQLVESYYNQYTATLGDWNTRQRDHFAYTYDADGNLIKKEDLSYGDTYEYTYAGGLLESETYTVSGTQMWKKSYIYVGGSNPFMMESVGAYETYSYTEYYEYDEQGRLVSSDSYHNSDSSARDKKTYAYDERGIVVEKITYKGSGSSTFTESSRELREYLGNGQYKKTSGSYSNGAWSDNLVYNVETYAYISSAYAPTNVTVVDASTAEAPNSANVTAEAPLSAVQNAGYAIYRGWEVIAVVPAEGSAISYVDNLLPNGSHDYIIQAVDTVTGVRYNCSTPVSISFDTELAAVASVEQLATEKGTAIDYGWEIPVYWIRFKWEAPVSDLEVIQYNIYQDGWSTPTIEHTDLTWLVDSVWVYDESEYPEYQQTETTVKVTAVYTLGESDGQEYDFSITYDAVKGVMTVSKAYVAGRYLYVDPAAQVSIYNAAGVLVGEYAGTANIDLATLGRGVFVARVKVGDHVQIVKMAR